MNGKFALVGLFAAFAAASPAAAQDGADSKWFVRVAGTQLNLADKIDLVFAGTPVPGSALQTKKHYTPTLHVGRVVGRDFAVVLTVGVPPHIDINGAGTLAPFGKLAETTYGPGTLTVQWRPVHNFPVQPYLGVGACYMHIFSTKDGAFQNVKIDDDLAPALEAGSEFMLNKRFGLFVEAKKAFLRTETRGTFTGAPVVGAVKLDPWAVSAGVTFRF